MTVKSQAGRKSFPSSAPSPSGGRGKARPGRKMKPLLDNPLDTAYLAAAAALDKKAAELIILSVARLTDYADYFLVASGSSTRQVNAIASHICAILKKARLKPLSVSGLHEGKWVLLDFGALVIHIFHQPIREYYDLESIWTDAPREKIDEKELSLLLPVKTGAAPKKTPR